MGMDLAAALATHLAATTALTSLTSERIYPLTAPQGVSLPYVTYQKISDPAIHAMGDDPKLHPPRFQVSCFAETYSGVRSIAIQVKTALQDYRTAIDGLLGDGTSGVDVQRIFFENEIDLSNADPETAGVTFHIVQDYIIWATT